MEFLQTMILTISLAAGGTPNYNYLDGSHFVESETRFSLDTRLELSALDRLVFVGIQDKTQSMKAPESYTFMPISEKYTVFAGMSVGDFEFGWEHYCIHPVLNSVTGGKTLTDPIFGAADTFYVKYEASFNLWK